MSVTMKTENGVPVLNLTGRITSANAAETEQQANAALGDYAGKALTLDLNDLEYISSAGLRVLLRLRKRFAGMEMVNVSSDVYEIFEMTGFTEMMPISPTAASPSRAARSSVRAPTARSTASIRTRSSRSTITPMRCPTSTASASLRARPLSSACRPRSRMTSCASARDTAPCSSC